MPLCPIKWQPLKFFAKLHKIALLMAIIVEGAEQFLATEIPWKTTKNIFLFHLNKLNILLANQILHILCIFIKPNVWYSWSLKKLANKRWNFTGPPFCGGWTQKLFEILADISFESSFQNTVLSNLLLFLCACYQVDLDDIHRNEAATSTARNFSIVDSYTSFF